jgi:hypothetical protein
VSFVVDHADDDAFLTLNEEDILSFGSQGGTPREIDLQPGDNHLIVKVFNQKSFEGGNPIWGKPEGWSFMMRINQGGQPIWTWQDGEDTVQGNGPQHGNRFVVARLNLHVDRKTGALTFRDAQLRLRP